MSGHLSEARTGVVVVDAGVVVDDGCVPDFFVDDPLATTTTTTMMMTMTAPMIDRRFAPSSEMRANGLLEDGLLCEGTQAR